MARSVLNLSRASEPSEDMRKAMDPFSRKMNINTYMKTLTYDFREFIS